jgi:hypothetical protein
VRLGAHRGAHVFNGGRRRTRARWGCGGVVRCGTREL